MANAYKYDQLNRIAQSNSFTNFDVANNKWMFGGAMANMYKTSYTYDANGNIKNLQRYNAAGVKFDDMDYKYDVQGSNLISNKLYHVNDAIASGIHTADIDDEGVFQNSNNLTTANNYTYDAIGNLTQDKTEEILEIKWTVSGKIKKIIRTGISTKADLEYVYDAMGNRIAKILKPDGSSLENGGTDNPTLWTYTYYVRDAQGNIMANYQKSTASSITSFKLIERSIYGSSRLGIDKTTIDLTASITPPTILNYNLGLKNYELSNHLGNVMAVISDRKIPRSILGTNINFYMPDIISTTDYYPFGMTMQERTFSAGVEAYRFGFNGKENDAESNTQDYGMRIYDGRLGRFLSVDPLTHDYPCYSSYQFAANSPIVFIDIDGLEPATPEQKIKALRIINAFEVSNNTKTAFKNVTRGAVIEDLKNAVANPAILNIPGGHGNYCALYAISFLAAYQDPEKYVSTVIQLYANGKAYLNGHEIKVGTSDFKNAKITNPYNVSAQIFGGAMRETDNLVMNYGTGDFWNSTKAGTMESWLENYMNYKLTKFDYGYECIADGIVNGDLPKLKNHIENGLLAVLLLDGDQMFAGDNNTGTGAFCGDHFIVVSGKFKYSEEKNTVTFNYYHSHSPDKIEEITMPLEKFRDMTNEVMMIQKK